MLFNEIYSSLKSLKQVTGERLKAVFDRYEKTGAAGVSDSGEMFLKQGSFAEPGTGLLTPAVVPAQRIREICEEKKIRWDERYADRVKVYKASDETVDFHGDIIKQDGWDFSRYTTNPVIMWIHDYEQPPIGSAINWEIEKSALFVYVLFMLPETYPWADTVFRMVDAGFMKGNSVGFVPKKVMDVDDEKEREKLGLGRWGVIFVEQLLLENSIVPIGSNPAALVQDALYRAAQKGIVGKDELKRLVHDDNKETAAPETVQMACDNVVCLLNRGNKFAFNSSAKYIEPVSRTVIPFKHYPLAPESESWDGPKEVAAADASALKKMCTWYDSENADVKSSYKLPHHKADGYKTVWRGVAAAMARLMQAQTQIPDSDRKACYNHLAKHYAEFDKEPPEYKAVDDSGGVRIAESDLSDIREALRKIEEYRSEEIESLKNLANRVNSVEENLTNEISALCDMIESAKAGSAGTRSNAAIPELYDDLFTSVKNIKTMLNSKE